jgi:hypothetical protein
VARRRARQRWGAAPAGRTAVTARYPLGRHGSLGAEDPSQLLRLQLFRRQHPDVIIGDGGFGTIQARIPEFNGEMVVTRYRLDELLDKLDELTTGLQDQPGNG